MFFRSQRKIPVLTPERRTVGAAYHPPARHFLPMQAPPPILVVILAVVAVGRVLSSGGGRPT